MARRKSSEDDENRPNPYLRANNDSKMIGEHKYTIGRIPPAVAIPIQVDLFKMLGMYIGALEEQKLEEVGMQLFAMMPNHVEGQTLVSVMEAVFSYVSCDGKRVDYETHFVGRIAELWQVFLFALEVNYGDFFEQLRIASKKRSESGAEMTTEA